MKKSDEKIFIQHPSGKSGVRIAADKYGSIKESILKILKKKKTMTFEELSKEVCSVLKGRFEGSIPWYYTWVKLDLEARNIIERIPGSRPQQIKLGKKFK